MNKFVAALAAACALAVSASAPAQDAYPSRPVKFVAPFPPGGTSDVLCRLLGQKLSEVLGQPFVVENKPGASSAIGHEYVAKQPADGYTIIISSSSALATNPHVRKKLGYDPIKDFAPVSMVASAGQVLVVRPDLGVTTVQALVALAKARPGKLNYGSGGIGITSHVSAEMFKAAAGVDIVHVPYKGTGQAVLDLVAGNVQLVFGDMAPSMPHIKAKRLIALAVTTSERNDALPDVPTMAEAGFPGFRSGVWWAVQAPRGTPDAVIQRLNAALGKIVAAKDVRSKYEGLGITPEHSAPQDVAQRTLAESEIVGRVLKAAGVEPE